MMSIDNARVSSVADTIARLPKAELHVHADGCVRIGTIADLARQQHITLPVPEEDLYRACVITEREPTLTEYLKRYFLPLLVLQQPDAVERMIYELCEDARRENVYYIEPRFGPALHTREQMEPADVIAAACRGWRAGARDFGLEGGLILCALRQMPPEENLAVARAGEPFLGEGVIGFDIAGIEDGYPILLHKEAFDVARAAGYGLTAHAGEGAGPQSVWDAVEGIGVTRVGHGVRSGEDQALIPVLRERGITLEMCPKSNVQTSAVRNLASHPIRAYYDAGIRVTVNTDGRTVSDTSVTAEMVSIHHTFDFDVSELERMTQWALDAGFAPAETRLRLQQAFASRDDGLQTQ